MIDYKEEAKMYRGIVTIMGFVWIITAMVCGNSFEDNAKLLKEIQIKDSDVNIISYQRESYRESLHNTRAKNLIIRSYLCKKDEHKLLNDSSYLKLITK